MNYGLSKNIIQGVSEILKKFKKIIVLEDDLIETDNILKFMNEGLTLYEKNKVRYAAVSIKYKNKIKSNTFIKGRLLGLGHLERAWINFDSDGKRLLQNLKKKKK